MEQEQSKCDCGREQKRKQRDTVSEHSKAKEKDPNSLVWICIVWLKAGI